MDRSKDRAVAKAQYLKMKRAEVRLRYTLMADAEIMRSIPEWETTFEEFAAVKEPAVLDFESEARRLLDAGA
jgi:hypothetical protein